MNGKYDDIINLPHHTSQKHPRMPVSDRAAQFSPFAALTGHGDAIKESARLTDERIEPDEQSREVLDEKLRLLYENADNSNAVTVTYFVPDERKTGGAYIAVTGCVKKIDTYSREIVMSDGIKIPIEDILDISGAIFSEPI